MSLFQAENISKSYGEKVLFEDISFSISHGQKVALIARNGTGKSTLLNIIAGLDQPDSGSCSFHSQSRLAYLDQQPEFEREITVSQALLSSDNELTRTIRAYEEFIQQNPNPENTAQQKKLQELIERMDALQAWDYESRVKQVLTKLKIGRLDAKTGTLSGGQIKRLALAKILIGEAAFILLDEPTNHLDLEMIEWLEGYLSRKKLTLLMVTHDRYFLDAVCNEIMELENGKLYNYRGNYSYFLEKKQERLETDAAQSEKAANLLRKETEWIRRTPLARTTKSKARIDTYYDLEEKAAQAKEQTMGKIRMDMARMGKKILEVSGVQKTYNGLRVVDNFSYVFKRGEKAGIVGPNGTGKSTLLNIITGKVKPDEGTVIKGETIRFGYYRQEGLRVDENKKVIEVIKDIAENITMGSGKVFTAAQFLHYFNFPFGVQNDRVGKLSGGEKRRLYLMTVLMKNPNFLILDEPTNDLDIDTLNILEEFLEDFPGCLLIVSHDRFFLDRLVDHLFVFKAPGKIKGYVGNYSAWRLKKQKEDASRKKAEKPKETTKPSKPREKKKLTYKEQKEFEALEKEIENLESEKETLLEKMNTGNLPPNELVQVSERFSEVEKTLEEKSDRWLELSEWA